MFQLITTILGIALASSAVMISVKYVNPTIPMQQESQRLVQEGFRSLQESWDSYRAINQLHEWKCDVYTTERGSYESCSKVLADPGFLPVPGWSSRLVPEYGFMPRPPKGLNWSYGKSDAGLYFCLEGSTNDATLAGIKRGRTSFALGSLVIGNSCGAITPIADESINPKNLRVTFWLKRNADLPDDIAIRLSPEEVNRSSLMTVSFYRDANLIPLPGHTDWPGNDQLDPDDPINCLPEHSNGKGNAWGRCKNKDKGKGKLSKAKIITMASEHATHEQMSI